MLLYKKEKQSVPRFADYQIDFVEH